MSTPTVSDRTIVRDAIMTALTNRQNQDGMRLKTFDVSPNFLTPEECTRAVTYCVVVTNETMQAFTQQQRDCAMTLLLILYVRDEQDVRAMLDKAIEDVYETMLLFQSAQSAAWKLTLDELTTDEGTTVAKPHAQAVLRWSCHHGRAMRAA